MAVRVICPECSLPLRVPDELVGRRIRCKICKAVFPAEVDPADENQSGSGVPVRDESVRPSEDGGRPLLPPPPPRRPARKAPASALRDEEPRPRQKQSLLPLVLACIALVVFFGVGIGIGLILVWVSPGVSAVPGKKAKAAREGREPDNAPFGAGRNERADVGSVPAFSSTADKSPNSDPRFSSRDANRNLVARRPGSFRASSRRIAWTLELEPEWPTRLSLS